MLHRADRVWRVGWYFSAGHIMRGQVKLHIVIWSIVNVKILIIAAFQSHSLRCVKVEPFVVQVWHYKVCSCCWGCLTLFTVNPFVGRTAYADSLNAGAMVGAGGVDTLTFLHVTLCPLPPRQAHAPSFLIHPVTAAQHRAWICNRTSTD